MPADPDTDPVPPAAKGAGASRTSSRRTFLAGALAGVARAAAFRVG